MDSFLAGAVASLSIGFWTLLPATLVAILSFVLDSFLLHVLDAFLARAVASLYCVLDFPSAIVAVVLALVLDSFFAIAVSSLYFGLDAYFPNAVAALREPLRYSFAAVVPPGAHLVEMTAIRPLNVFVLGMIVIVFARGFVAETIVDRNRHS